MTCRAVGKASHVQMPLSAHLPVTLQAPLHFQRSHSPNLRHGIHLSVAIRAVEPLRDMDAVIEVDEIGKVVHPRPSQGNAVAGAVPQRLEHGRVGKKLRVAGHADFRRRDPGKTACLHRRVTVPAVDPVVARMVLVTERDRLTGQAWSAGFREYLVNRDPSGREQRDKREQTHLQSKDCRRQEDLRHFMMRLCTR